MTKYQSELKDTIFDVLKNVSISSDVEVNKRVLQLLVIKVLDAVRMYVQVFELRMYKRGYHDCLMDITNNAFRDEKKRVSKLKYESDNHETI